MESFDAEMEQLRIEEQLLREKRQLLYAQHQEKLRKEAEEKERQELSVAIEVRATACDGQFVTVKMLPEPRRDIVDLISSTPHHYDHISVSNRIQVDAWPALKMQIEARPGVKVTHLLGVEGKINEYFNADEFVISLHKKYFLVKCHSKAITAKIAKIPGTSYNAEVREFQIALTEGWRLIETLENYTRQNQPRKITWSPEALAFAEGELERRQKLNAIALKTDSDFDVEFLNGHKLRPFQKVGVEFVVHANLRALIADQMGLGKTWQALAAAMWAKADCTWIVCPAHLKANWSREIIQLTGIIPYICRGREPDNDTIQTLLLSKPKFVIINYDILSAKTTVPAKRETDAKGDIHVTPETERWLWADLINMTQPQLVVVDEAHYTKNTEAGRSKAVRSLQSKYRIALTGTPVLNRPGEYWAVLNWINPELFPSESKFLNQYTSNGRDARNVEELRDLLKTIMIRRLKKDVVAELPPINRITQVHELSAAAQLQYKKVLTGVYSVIDKAGNEIKKNITSILTEIGRLKQVCSADKVDAVVELATNLYDGDSDAQGGNKKVLIFSQYVATVKAIHANLETNALMWTGETPMEERTRLENEFQTNPNVHYLVVSLMTGQTGLNLTAAGHVIFADLWWTPAAHAQAEERAYGRLSNMHGCDSYYIVAQGTIEEWVQEMLAKKLEVINQVVEGIDEERDPQIGMGIIEKLKAMRGM